MEKKSSRMPAVEYDTGLGTTYERWALNRLLVRLHARWHFNSLLEAPGDGMTGIAGLNSLVLGLQGVRVSLLMPENPKKADIARQAWQAHAPNANLEIIEFWDGTVLPFYDNEVDLVWNFNVMPCQPDPQSLLAEMARISRDFVMVCVPNRRNYAFWLHRLHHRVANDPWDHGDVELMEPGPWQTWFRNLGMEVIQVDYLDCPLWPDIVDPAELMIDFFPFTKPLANRMKPETRYRWEYTALPYYNPGRNVQIHERMVKLAYFENTRFGWLKRLFGHHVCIIARKG
jgi:hypothetical protein